MAVASRLLSGDGFAFETVTVADSSKALTAGTYAPVNQDKSRIRAFCTLTGGQIRYRYDGTAPTNTVGHLASFGDVIYLEGTVNVEQFRAIRTGDVSATLSVTYERVCG